MPQLRTRRVVLHVRESELGLLKAAAAKTRQRVSEWGRDSLLRLAQLQIVDDPPPSDGRRGRELVRQG